MGYIALHGQSMLAGFVGFGETSSYWSVQFSLFFICQFSLIFIGQFFFGFHWSVFFDLHWSVFSDFHWSVSLFFIGQFSLFFIGQFSPFIIGHHTGGKFSGTDQNEPNYRNRPSCAGRAKLHRWMNTLHQFL